MPAGGNRLNTMKILICVMAQYGQGFTLTAVISGHCRSVTFSSPTHFVHVYSESWYDTKICTFLLVSVERDAFSIVTLNCL